MSSTQHDSSNQLLANFLDKNSTFKGKSLLASNQKRYKRHPLPGLKVLSTSTSKPLLINDQKSYHPRLSQRVNNTSGSKPIATINDNKSYHARYRVPSYMIIGAMKGGTTTLTKSLEMHPDIFRSKKKELHFFDSWNHNPKKSNTTASLEHFYDRISIEVKNGFSEKLIGDSTPRYIIMSDVIPTIKRLTPWVKIIAILRNPVDRLFSHYVMTMNAIERLRGNTLNEYIKDDLNHLMSLGLINYKSSESTNLNVSNDEAWFKYVHAKKFYSQILVGRGLYSLQLRQWFRHFPKSSFLVLNYDDLKKENGTQLMFNKTVEFLGLRKYNIDNDGPVEVVRNKGNYSNFTLDFAARKFLHKLYEPYNRELSSLLGPEWEGVWELKK